MIIAVDFDGTIVEHKYPQIGEEISFAVETLKLLSKEKHHLILWTVREGQLQEDAVQWCKDRGLEFYAVNKNYPEETTSTKGFTRKINADLFIDDRSLGGIADWGTTYQMIKEKRMFEPFEKKEIKTRKLSFSERIKGYVKED